MKRHIELTKAGHECHLALALSVDQPIRALAFLLVLQIASGGSIEPSATRRTRGDFEFTTVAPCRLLDGRETVTI